MINNVSSCDVTKYQIIKNNMLDLILFHFPSFFVYSDFSSLFSFPFISPSFFLKIIHSLKYL